MEREFIKVADKNAVDDAADKNCSQVERKLWKRGFLLLRLKSIDKNVVKWKESPGNKVSLLYVEIADKNVVK